MFWFGGTCKFIYNDKLCMFVENVFFLEVAAQ